MSTPLQNKLLAALPESVLNRTLPYLDSVDLTLGQMLYESGSIMDFVYFPVTAIVSLLHVMENGASAEIALVGNNGIVGIAVFMGGESTNHEAVVQRAGIAFRMPVSVFKRLFSSQLQLQQLLLRYTQTVLTQTAQTAACNRHHSIDQQFCRWLLSSEDLLSNSTLVMTQELISNMLGVRRQGVTAAAKKLQIAGLIKYNRGHIKVLDRVRLEERVCECYSAVKNETNRLMSQPLST